MAAAGGILAYMKGTSGFGITQEIGTSIGICLEVFADTDYASKATERRSVSGGAIMCGSACVCWLFRTQKCVTLSTSEAEYVALGDAVKELFLRQIWRFIIPGKGMPCFPVFEDNQGVLRLSTNLLVSNSTSKHIDVRHHFLREFVRQGDISVNDVPSEY